MSEQLTSKDTDSHKAQLHCIVKNGNKYPMGKTGMSWKNFVGKESEVGLKSC